MTNIMLKTDSKSSDKMTLSSHKRSHKCELCGKTFSLAYNLKKHVRSHTGERPYECNECAARFTQSGGLRNHIVSIHNRIDHVYICDYCGKQFPIKDRLKLHMRTHTGEKPYSCKQCKKTFARGSQLSQHMRSHTKARPFQCDVCESVFASRNNLVHHLKRHRDERDYTCNVCGKTFIRRDGLQKHLSWYHGQHRAFECKICNRKYKGHLLQHMRIHREEKPHVCPQCNMRFVQKSQLTVHLRTHSGIRPYRCDICCQAFAHSTALKMHMHRHTGEKPFKCLICSDKAFSQLPHLKKHMLRIHKTDKPYLCVACEKYFKTKNQLMDHKAKDCKVKNSTEKSSNRNLQVVSMMTLDKMRVLLAMLLQKISSPSRLVAFGFGKKLIDHVLCDSITSSGREVCSDESLNDLERLRKNVDILLDWTIPKKYMEKFRRERRSTEELLKELAS